MTIFLWCLLAVPAIFVWVRGRQLLPKKGEAAFADLHFQKAQHTGLAVGVLVGLVLFNAPSTLLLKFGFLLLLLILADYPYRKGLFGLTQGPMSYLVSTVRLSLGLHGHGIFLALIPAVAACFADLASPSAGLIWPLSAAAATALLALLAMHFTPWRFKALVPSTPLPPAALDGLGLGILEKAKCQVPEVRRFGFAGGFYFNSYDLTSFYRPLVLLSDDLLETLGPGESRAVFAIHVAHIETETRRRRLGYELGFLLLVLLGLAATWMAARSSLGIFPHAGWIWPMLLLLGRNGWATSRQQMQHRTDVRGVELSGDPQLWADAIEKVHAFNYLPRRWSGDDSELSHPSLANRLRAVQEAQPQASLPAPPPLPMGDLVVRGVSDRGTVVVFGREGLQWLEGVSLQAGADPRAVYDLAKVRRSATYRELVDLRLQAEMGGNFWLEAEAADGRRRVRLANADVATVKGRLDAVDQQLLGTARHRAPVASEGRSKTSTLRFNGLLVALLAFFQPLTGAVALAGLTVLALPSRTALALAGTLALASQGVALVQGEGLMAADGYLGIGGPLLSAFCMLFMGLHFLNTAVRRYRLKTVEPAWTLWLPFLVMAPVAVVSAALGALRWSLPMPRWQIYLWAREIPMVVPLLLAMAVALLLLRRTSLRLIAVACAVVAGGLAVLGSPLSRHNFVDDPMARQGPAFVLDATPTILEPRHGMDLDAWTGLVRWSPSGQRLAVQSSPPQRDEEDWDGGSEMEPADEAELSHSTFSSTFSVELGNGQAMWVVADDVAFIDEQRLLLFETSGERPRLRSLDLSPTLDGSVDIELPPLVEASFRWLEAEQQWQVSGYEAEADDTLVRYRGDLASLPREDLRLVLPTSLDSGYLNWTLGPRSALLIEEDFAYEDMSWVGFLQATGSFGGLRHLSLMTQADTGGEARHLATTTLSCVCLEPPPAVTEGICLLGDGSHMAMWSVDLESGQLRVLGHIESDSEFVEGAHLASGVVLRLDDSHFLWLDPKTGRGRRLDIPRRDSPGHGGEGDDAEGEEPLGPFAELVSNDFLSFWDTGQVVFGEGHLALVESQGEGSEIRLFELPTQAATP